MKHRAYPIRLTEEEQEKLHQLCAKGKAPARSIRRAQILLWADENRPEGKLKDKEIAQQLQIHTNTVHLVRKCFVEQGLQKTLERKKRLTPPNPPKVTGELEARIIALSCSEPPPGRSRWTLRLLADKAVELHYIDSLSYDTVDRILKKANLSLTSRNAGAFHPSKTRHS